MTVPMRGNAAAGAALWATLLAAACAGSVPAPQRLGADGDVLLAASLPAAELLEAGRTPPSDVVGLWQSVLWADGYAPHSAVTCAYDRATAVATRIWQSNHRLSADGIVGAVTWGAALDRLAPAGPWTVYRGELHDVPLRLDRRGRYEVYDAGEFHPLHTGSVTLVQCR